MAKSAAAIAVSTLDAVKSAERALARLQDMRLDEVGVHNVDVGPTIRDITNEVLTGNRVHFLQAQGTYRDQRYYVTIVPKLQLRPEWGAAAIEPITALIEDFDMKLFALEFTYYLKGRQSLNSLRQEVNQMKEQMDRYRKEDQEMSRSMHPMMRMMFRGF